MDYQFVITDKRQEVADDFGKDRIVSEKRFRKSMNPKGFCRYVPFRINVLLVGLPRRHVIDQLNTTDFNNTVASVRVKARGFRIENNFTHDTAKFPSPASSKSCLKV